VLGKRAMAISMRRAKLPGQPERPMAPTRHWNWPRPGTVKAEAGLDSGWSGM
jgi:hypothetical protein